MKLTKQLVLVVLLALLLLPVAVFAEEPPPERGSVEFGVRYVWGDVYGRPDLQGVSPGCLGCGTPFDPLLKTSKYNEYRDLRNGFFVRRFNARFDNVLNSNNYVSLQSQKTLYRDQGYLATFGQYGRFKVQFRYDEIPHTYTNTARTLFTETSPGVWSFPTLIRQTLQATTAANLPSVVNTQVVPQSNFFTPSIIRKAGTALVSYNVTPDFNINGLFWRESQNGTRPIGLIMNSSPSASATAGYGVELPETISYFNNIVRMGAEYGKQSWAVQAAYIGSFFQNNIGQLVWDNPFRLTTEQAPNPLSGRMDLYPDNQAHYLNFAGATDVGKWVRVQASITPGWLRQNDAFLPYTTNTAINTCGDGTQPCSSLAVLPVPSLNGNKQTLAMNYTLVTLPWKSFQFKAAYRHYDYNNNTAIHDFTPAQGDVGVPSVAAPTENLPIGFNRKTLELTGNWYFAKRSSAKVGYEGEWMDRSHRDAEHSVEHSIVGAVDVGFWKDLLVRVSFRHSDRKPDEYRDEANAEDPATDLLCTDTSTVFTEEQRCHRRFDEAARLLNRFDALAQYSVQKFTFSGGFQTIQQDFNRAGGSNSPTPLNFSGALVNPGPYYLYGALKDLSFIYTFDGSYAFSKEVSLFAEYTHEKYHKRMISRNRTPAAAGQTILTCNACDSGNNDWESTYRDVFDTYAAGADFYLGKKLYFTPFYSLAAGKGNVLSRALGDPSIVAAGPNRFTLVGTSAALNYPEAVTRIHEVAAVFKYKLTKNVMPKLEYRYQQFDNKDFQTSAMTQYMGCTSSAPPAAPVVGCTTPILNSGTSPTPSPGATSPFYPYFVVGDPSSARYLFLGVDQPSYRAHYIAGTLEYHF